MKIITINKTQKYKAEKITNNNNNIKLIGAYEIIGEDEIFTGDLLFPNISNLEDFVIEDGQDFDVEVGLQQQVDDLEVFILMQGGLV